MGLEILILFGTFLDNVIEEFWKFHTNALLILIETRTPKIIEIEWDMEKS